MLRSAAVLAVLTSIAPLMSLGACFEPASFHCTTDDACTNGGASGWCESVGYCSFADDACPSGRRFGAASDGYGDRCVEGAGFEVPLDAAIDSSPDSSPGTVDASPPDAEVVVTGCPAGYVQPAGTTHWYRALTVSAGWTNQRAICGIEPANAYLAIPDDAAELAALLTLTTEPVWVGLSDAADEGVYVTVHGAPASFLPWAASEPDNNGNQDCVLARPTGELETAICGAPALAICECEPIR